MQIGVGVKWVEQIQRSWVKLNPQSKRILKVLWRFIVAQYIQSLLCHNNIAKLQRKLIRKFVAQL